MPTEWDLECLAWHEAGHAVVSLVMPEREPIERISIEPGDEAFGFMRTAPRPHHNGTEVSLCSTMAVFLAGPLAERRFLGRATTGGADDIANARTIARDMVLRFGMGPRLGLHCPAIAGEAISEHLLRAVQADEERLLRAAERAAKTALSRNAPLVRTLAQTLLARHTLTGQELGDLIHVEINALCQLTPSFCGFLLRRFANFRSVILPNVVRNA
jgi:ATP-dependent Zn protease